MPDTTCEHKNVAPIVLDQTAGVECQDCGLTLAYCWGGKHVPRALWNRAVEGHPAGEGWLKCDPIPNACALCEMNVQENAHA